MTNALDNAIARIQDIALALTSVTVRSAPDYPIENVDPLPMAVTYTPAGNATALNSSTLLFFPTVNVEFHFSRTNLKQAYQQINAVALESSQKIAGDPTLNRTVDTALANAEGKLFYTVRPYNWGKPTGSNVDFYTQMLMFELNLKVVESPL